MVMLHNKANNLVITYLACNKRLNLLLERVENIEVRLGNTT